MSRNVGLFADRST